MQIEPPPSAPTPKDESFLYRWSRWHRRGALLYFLWVTLGSFAIAVVIASGLSNLLEHGWHLTEWDRWLDRVNLSSLAAMIFFSVNGALIRFDRNEQRYAQLLSRQR